MPDPKITVNDIKDKKGKEKIAALTAYDYSFARLIDDAGIDIILVGDSLGMVSLGYDSTVNVTMEDMLHHSRAVSRGTRKGLVVSDMPFGSFQKDIPAAVENASRFIKDGGAQAVKIEGGFEVKETIKKIIESGIPVMGHLGLTPQTADKLGGYKVQGKTKDVAQKIIDEAYALEEVGVFSIVLECVPYQLARLITDKINIPTIGIGAGPYCDGQVLVIHDILGLQDKVKPKFVRLYSDVRAEIKKAVCAYREDVLRGEYPSLKESYTMPDEEMPIVNNGH